MSDGRAGWGLRAKLEMHRETARREVTLLTGR